MRMYFATDPAAEIAIGYFFADTYYSARRQAAIEYEKAEGVSVAECFIAAKCQRCPALDGYGESIRLITGDDASPVWDAGLAVQTNDEIGEWYFATPKAAWRYITRCRDDRDMPRVLFYQNDAMTARARLSFEIPKTAARCKDV